MTISEMYYKGSESFLQPGEMRNVPMEREPEPTVVESFVHPWEADLARDYLADQGIPAWVETSGLDNPYRLPAAGMGLVRLYVSADRAEEARSLLAQLSASEKADISVPPDRQEQEREGQFVRRPLWPTALGVAVVVALSVSAIPHRLRLPALVVVLLAGVLWFLFRPRRRTGSGGG